jgi:hypothetical protein
MSEQDITDCLNAEHGFTLDDDTTVTRVLTVVCRACQSSHRLNVIQWPGAGEYHREPCLMCGTPLPAVRCDVGSPLLIDATAAARPKRYLWSRLFPGVRPRSSAGS